MACKLRTHVLPQEGSVHCQGIHSHRRSSWLKLKARQLLHGAQEQTSGGLDASTKAAGPTVILGPSKLPKGKKLRQAVPVKPEPARILSRAGASRTSQAAVPDSTANEIASTMTPFKKSQELPALSLSAEEKLQLELADTLWLTCSALCALGRPDDIAGLRALPRGAFAARTEM